MNHTVKQLKSGKYAVVENGKNILVTNNYGDIPDKERAILAAAAPELLECMKSIMRHEHIRAYLPYSPDDPVFLAARAAIAKAEGRE
jgi:hypothetical protein